MTLKRLAATLVLSTIALVGCNEDEAPAPDSDSSSSYNSGAIPVDDKVYDITGTIVTDVSSLTRQTSPGTISTPTCYGTSGCYGGGTYFGPVSEGKGYVRIKVTATNTDVAEAPVSSIVILKVTDTKATALLPGDNIKFRCRRQYEAVAAVRDNQTFNAKSVETWELDFCRLASPVIVSNR